MLNERPYLSEAGPVVFDALYDTVIRQVSYIVKSPSLSHNMISLDTLIKDSVNVLIGVPSRTYHLDKVQCNEPAINSCVANGGWVLKDLGTGTTDPNPGRWNTP